MNRVISITTLFLFSASVCLADSSIERNFRIGTIVPGGTAGSVIHLQGSPPKVTQDNDNFFYNDTDNELYFGGKTLVTADIVLKATGGALFNQNKANVDFGVSTVNNSNFLFVDASEDSVIIGNTSESSTATLAIHIVDVNNQRGISVVGASGQSQNLLEFANISGNILAQINANGGAVFNENGLDTDFRVEGDATTHLIFADASAEGVMFGTSTDLSSRVGIVPNAATDIGLVIKAAASQTASLTEWQNSSAALLLSIGELGQIRVAGSWDPVIGAPTAGLVFVDNGGTYNDTLIAKDTSGNIGYVVTNPGSHQFFTAGSSTPMFEITPSGVSLASITLTGQGAYTAPTGVIFNNSGGTANDSGIWRDTDQFVINYKSSQGLFSEAEHRFYLGDGLAVTFDQEAAKTFVLFDLGAGDGSAKKGLVIKGKASQSASLLQLQNSDASVFVDSGDGLASSEFVINEQGLDIDFRIEGDTISSLFVIDAGLDQVQFGNHTKFASVAGIATEGALWADSTQKALQTYQDGIEQTISGVIFTSTADATVGNTLTEGTLLGTGVGTKTLPANFFVAGKTIRLTASGYFSTDLIPNTLNIRFKLGSTTIVSTGAFTPSGSLSNQFWRVELFLTCRTTGATGTVIAQGVFQDIDTGITAGLNAYPMLDTTTNTIDTTASQIVDLSADWDGIGAQAGDTITATNSVLEIIN